MKVREMVYEETYGGHHIYQKNATDFENYEIINIKEYSNSKVISTTPVGKVCQHEWEILNINKQEFEQLKKMSKKSIFNKIEEIQTQISDITISFPILFKEIEVKYTFDFSDNAYWNNSYIRKYTLESPNCQKGEFYQRTTLLDLLIKYIVHSNNYTEYKLFNRQYVGINGKLDILDKEVCSFINKIHYDSKEYQIFRLVGLHQLRDAYNTMLKKVNNIQY